MRPHIVQESMEERKKKGPGQLGREEKQKESKKRTVKEGESTQRIARRDP